MELVTVKEAAARKYVRCGICISKCENSRWDGCWKKLTEEQENCLMAIRELEDWFWKLKKGDSARKVILAEQHRLAEKAAF